MNAEETLYCRVLMLGNANSAIFIIKFGYILYFGGLCLDFSAIHTMNE